MSEDTIRMALLRLRADGDGIPVKIEELLLTAGEPAHVNNLPYVDSHALKGWAVGNRRNDEGSVVFEANEPSIEQMINARRQEQPILTVETLVITGVPPRLAVTCHQV